LKRSSSTALILVIYLFASTFLVAPASAEDKTITGALSKIELAADGKSATTTIKDNKSGESYTILVIDELTLDKIKDKRIVEGDEIRSKFEKKDGKNRSKIFKKTAGC
jgi:hypothetical protein